MSSDSMQQEIEQVALAHRVLDEVLNPAWIKDKAPEVFPGAPETRRILAELTRYDWTYNTVGPDESKLPRSLWSSAEALLGRPISIDLKITVLIPTHLLSTTVDTRICPCIHWSGGGGVTGDPMFEDWIYRADMEFVKVNNMISIHGRHRLLPESDSEDLRHDRSAFWTWLFCNLQEKLGDANQHLEIAWDNSYMFGASFGGLMALESFLELAEHECKPLGFRLKKIILRYPVTHEYRRELGKFMGVAIDPIKALADSNRVLQALDNAPWMVPRTGSTPPDSMLGALLFAAFGQYHRIYKGLFPIDNIKNTQKCPDEQTHILIRHGDADQFVNVADSRDTVQVMKAKWPELKVDLEIQPGRDHAWDYSESLSAKMQTELGSAQA